MRTYVNVMPIGSRSGPLLKQVRSAWLLAPSVAGMSLTQFPTVLAFVWARSVSRCGCHR